MPSPVSGDECVAANQKRVVFVGAGHAHLYALKRVDQFTRKGYEVMIVSPDNFWYSGLATGVLGGRYSPDQDQVNIHTLLKKGGARVKWIRSRVASLDPKGNSVWLEDGRNINYDVLSLNVGSETRPLDGADDSVYAIKPLQSLIRLRDALKAKAAVGARSRVVVVGGGASGCEVAANIRALAGEAADITILLQGHNLAQSFSRNARSALHAWLQKIHIQVRYESMVTHLENGIAVTDGGERFEFDFLVNATGLHSPAFIAAAGLATGERGDLLVDKFLRSTSHENIFGGGDCVRFRDRDLARIGVYAVREAPILFHNLLAHCDGRPLKAFRPQQNYLLILNLGDGIGLACWRNFHWLGRAAYWLKDRLDRRFLARYQNNGE